MSEMESSSPPVADTGALLGKLLSNPDLLRSISSVVGSSGTVGAGNPPSMPVTENSSTAPKGDAMADGISRVLANPEMMAKLPDVMKMLAPMVQQSGNQAGGAVPTLAASAQGGGGGDRDAAFRRRGFLPVCMGEPAVCGLQPGVSLYFRL